MTNEAAMAAAQLIYNGLHEIAYALHRLGTADAATPMGATEVLSNAINEAADKLTEAIGSHAIATMPSAD